MASPKDSGYAWVVAIAAMVSHALQYGVVWTVGVFYVVFLENIQHNGAGEVALVSSLNTATYYMMGPIAGMLTNIYGPRTVGIIGGFIGSLGLVLSMFATSIYHLYVTFGFLTGAGLGLTFIPAITATTSYFDKYQSMALGLAASGVGIGTFLFPPLIRWLQYLYGWRGVLLILGGINFNLVCCACLYRPRESSQTGHNVEPDQNQNNLKIVRKPLSGIGAHLNVGIFKNTNYILLCIQIVLVTFGLSIVYVHLAAYAGTLGFSDNKSALLFSTLGLCNFLGRLIYGAINQHPKVNAQLLFIIGFMIAGVSTIILPLVSHYYAMQAYAAVFGLSTACFGTILPQIVIEFLGEDLITNGYGYLLMFMAFGTLAGGPTAGILYDITMDYSTSLYLGGSIIVLGTCILFVPFLKTQREQKKNRRVLRQLSTSSTKPLVEDA